MKIWSSSLVSGVLASLLVSCSGATDSSGLKVIAEADPDRQDAIVLSCDSYSPGKTDASADLSISIFVPLTGASHGYNVLKGNIPRIGGPDDNENHMQALKASGQFSVTNAELKILDESGKQIATLIYKGEVLDESELTYALVPIEDAASRNTESDAKYGQGTGHLVMTADQTETELSCIAWDEENSIKEQKLHNEARQ